MFISGFGIIGAMRPAAIRERDPDLWDLSEEEARTMSEPAARLSKHIPAKYAELVENAWDPVLLFVAVRSSLGDRFAQERRIVNEIRSGRAPAAGAAEGAAAARQRRDIQHHPENVGGAGPSESGWWDGIRTVDLGDAE